MNDAKSNTAFRTISEVGDTLALKPHVLRFWEGKFEQIQPVKRGNGRRYYRPEDVALIAGIRHLLHEQGMTIRGVQKMIKDDGVAHVRMLADASPVPPPSLGEGLSQSQRRQLESARDSLAQARGFLDDDNV